MAASLTDFQSEGTITSSGLGTAPRFSLMVVMILSLVLVSVSAILLARLTDRPWEVFSPYTAVLGQNKIAAISHGFSCRMSTYPPCLVNTVRTS